MTRSLAHRGPDGEGMFIRPGIGLGHRRLAIIDPVGGVQPMSNAHGTLWITYNGEIYNFRELRAQLAHAGHMFVTESDTEVLLLAYEEWGKACVERLRGMFVFCIADFRNRTLFLARDHFGIKPLVYVWKNDCFAFASELQALREVSDVPFEIDPQSIDQYLWLQYIPAPRTIFQGVYKLPPGHRMTISMDDRGSEPLPGRYWKPMFQKAPPRSEEDWLEELDHVLRESVRAHLVADVPFGAFLSGGVDSSAIVGYMSELLDQPVSTFTIGFEEEEASELPYARRVAQITGSEYHELIVRGDALSILPDLVRHYGEPFGDSSAIPTFMVSRFARECVPMVLSGDGGDEMFAGYNSYGEWMKHFMRSYDLWIGLIQYLSRDWRSKLWKSEYRFLPDQRVTLLHDLFAEARGYDPIQVPQSMDLQTYLPFDILTKVDIASMMHGLEVRTPFVDTEVWRLASSMPASLNMRRMEDGTWRGKLALKTLLERRYPADLLRRPKMGFGLPVARWFGPGGTWRTTLEERLFDPSSPLHTYFEPQTMRELLERQMTGPLWTLLFLDEWLRQFYEDRGDQSVRGTKSEPAIMFSR